MNIDELKTKRDDLQARLRAFIDCYVQREQAELTAEIDAVTKKIVELMK